MPVSKDAQNYCDFFTHLQADTPFEVYENIYDEDVYFEDPFQQVRGIKKLFAIFEHMYETLYQPSFEIMECVEQSLIVYIRWKFYFKRNKDATLESFTGVSRVEFSDEGRVLSHVDYWDAATHVYEKVPLLGAVLRWIKGKIRVDS